MTVRLCVHIIAHDVSLQARLASVRNLERILGNEDTQVRWVTLPKAQLTPDKMREACHESSDKTPHGPLKTRFDQYAQPMSGTHVSNCLHHIAALRAAAESGDEFDVHLVVEDDVQYNAESVAAQIQTAILESPEDADAVFTGQLTNLTHGRFAEYRTELATLATCESYLITSDAAKRILEHMTPVRFHTPVQISFAAETAGLGVFVCSPTVFLDGSKLGVVPSSVEPNNACMYNPLYKKIYARLRDHDATADLRSMCESNPLRASPDFLHIEGVLQMRGGDLEGARQTFERALDAYEEGGAAITNASKFLHDYVNLSRQIDCAAI